MKKLCLVMFLSLFFTEVIFAQPFLVGDDPNPEGVVISCLLTFNDGEEIEVPVPLHYDLSNLPTGAYTVTAKAKSLWGVSESVSLDFIKDHPLSLGNINISID